MRPSGRAGRHEWGYVEPTDAAWEILEEALEPFIQDMRRQIELGLEAEALEICKGVVLGLYRIEHGESSPVAEWVPDFPAEVAGNMLETWLTEGTPRKKTVGAVARQNRPAFPQEFVDQLVHDWRDMISRILS